MPINVHKDLKFPCDNFEVFQFDWKVKPRALAGAEIVVRYNLICFPELMWIISKNMSVTGALLV